MNYDFQVHGRCHVGSGFTIHIVEFLTLFGHGKARDRCLEIPSKVRKNHRGCTSDAPVSVHGKDIQQRLELMIIANVDIMQGVSANNVAPAAFWGVYRRQLKIGSGC